MDCVALSGEHKKALGRFTAEFAEAGETHIPAFMPDPTWSFDEIVQGFARQSQGLDLPDGWVPGTTRFLVHDGRILGLFNLRHRLTDQLRLYGGHVGYSVRPSERRKGHGTRLLEAAKQLARDLGIEHLLATCAAANTASARVIEKCGGVCEEQFYYEPLGYEIRRYWIDLSRLRSRTNR